VRALAELAAGLPQARGVDLWRWVSDHQEQAATAVDDWWAQSGEGGAIDVVDMFSGCGGMSAGFRMANAVLPAYRLVMAVDIDPVANRSYEANLGLRPEAMDVGSLSRSRRQEWAILDPQQRDPGRPLVLIGCAPCQGFSSHRNAAGEVDPRNDLFEDFIRLAVKSEPDVVVIENVPELCIETHWPRVARARARLTAAGYRVHLAIHNMAEFGLPQERFRAVMVAARRPFTPIRGHLDRSGFRTVRQAIGHLPRVAAGEVGADPMHYSAGHRDSTIELIRSVPPNGGSRPAGSGPESLRNLARRQGKEAYEDVYGRLWWDRPAITVTAYARNPASGRFVHPTQHRGLTVREAALLQGFPSTYEFAGNFDERFRQIGNAVPPIFAVVLALNVVGNLLQPPTDWPGDGLAHPVGKSFSRLIPGLKAGTSRLVPA
jgi:DNA (cytosine-5)-methyltransferase 1